MLQRDSGGLPRANQFHTTMRIKDTVAIVTGGAQGIGEKICCALMERGGKVSILDVNEDKGLQLKTNLEKKYGFGRVMFTPCNVTSGSQMKDAFRKTKETFGCINIVCNNAGIMVWRNEKDRWEDVIDVNLKGVVRGTLLAVQYMGQTYGGEGGVIVNVASMAGIFPMGSKHSVYTATKFAVVGFSRSLEDLKEKEGIRVNCICPSYTETQMVPEYHPNHEELWRETPEYAHSVVNVGLLRPEFVAKGVIQLIEDEHNAAVMRVTKRNGIDFKNYRKAKL